MKASASPSLAPSSTPADIVDEIQVAPPAQRVSAYVLALDGMLEGVLDGGDEHEEFLFNEAELAALRRIVALDYEARYLLMRLYLRIDRWHRLSTLDYVKDVEDIDRASRSLFHPDVTLRTPPPVPPPKPACTAPGVEVLDLTEDDAEMQEIIIEDSDSDEEVKPATGELDLSRVAEGRDMLACLEVEDLLDLLSADELSSLGKTMRVVNRGTKRADWVAGLLKCGKQATLSFFASRTRGKATSASLGIAHDEKGHKIGQLGVVAERALKTIGPVIRLHSSYRRLLDRLSLIYHRTAYTVGSTSSLTASLLARFGKRVYPTYEVSRTTIFESREQLLAFEAALATERKMEELLGELGTAKVGVEKTTADQRKEEREKGEREGIKLFESVEEEWKRYCEAGEVELAEEEQSVGAEEQKLLYYKKRFHPGWPLSRVAYKAASVYGKLRNRPREIELLETLLAQHSFHRGKRGAWYDRLALLFMNYPSVEELADDCSEKKAARLKKARLTRGKEICVDGLGDSHLIYHAPLMRRINRIESALMVPKTERSNFVCKKQKAEARIMEGERLDDPTVGIKSVWRARDGREISVEALALEQYQSEGWSGFHSESGILVSLFVLLFYDVLFLPVPGVFQTEFQSAPLDLATDAFAIVRRTAVDTRLEALQNGQAPNILARIDEQERPRETWCAVNWDKYSKSDLVEIVRCLGGAALNVICRVFAEDFSARRGGVPDLCLWDPAASTIMFAEVKGPGDRLSSTQDEWVDLLMGAGVPVELCHVMTTENKIAQEEEKEKGKGKGKRKRKQTPSDDDDEE